MKNIAILLSSRAIVVGLQIIYLKIYTHYLDSEQIGHYFYLLAGSYLANALFFLPIDYYQQAKLKKIVKVSGGVLPLVFFNIRLIKFYIALSTIFIVATAFRRFEYVPYIIAGVLLAYFTYVVNAIRNTLNNIGQSKSVSISFIHEALLKVIITYAIAMLVGGSELVLIWSWIISLIFSGTYLSITAKKSGILTKTNEYKIEPNEVLAFSYPFSIGAGCNWLQVQGYRIAFVPLGYASAVGIFETVSGIGATAIGALSIIYNQHFSPKIYNTKGKFALNYIFGALLLLALISAIIVFAGPIAVKLLTNERLESYWGLIYYGLCMGACSMIIGALSIKKSIDNDTVSVLSSNIIGSVISLVGFSILYFYDLISAGTIGAPLLASQLTVALCLFWLSYGKITNEKKV